MQLLERLQLENNQTAGLVDTVENIHITVIQVLRGISYAPACVKILGRSAQEAPSPRSIAIPLL